MFICLITFSTDFATNPEDTQQTPSDDITFSQSCDLDLHDQQPVGLKGASRKPTAKRHHKVVVDEEAVRQSMEMSQRLSEDAIGTYSNNNVHTVISENFVAKNFYVRSFCVAIFSLISNVRHIFDSHIL